MLSTEKPPLLMPRNAMRAIVPCDLASTRPYCMLDFITNWEDFCSKPHWGPNSGIATIDDTIAGGYPPCLLWGLGAYPPGKRILVGNHPKWDGYDGYPVHCDPCGLEVFDDFSRYYPGFIEVFKSRNEVSAKVGNDGSMIYVGGARLDLFDRGSWTYTKNNRCDTLLRPIIKAGFKYIGLDASAACGQKDWVTPIMWLAERALVLGLIPVIESIPIVHPELFPWANGRFANLCNWSEVATGIMSGRGYFNDGCPGCFTKRFGLYAGNIEQTTRIRAAYDRSLLVKETPIVDFGDASPAVWKK